MAAPIQEVQALTFDCYGTLIDWERGLLAVLRPWAERVGLTAADDELLAHFAAAETGAESDHPQWRYSDILRESQRRLARSMGVEPTEADADALARSVGDWPPFDDTVEALRRLRRRCKLIIVSNVDRASFLRTNAALSIDFDAIVTAEDVGAYKPDRRMFEAARAAVESLDVAPDHHLHVAQSLFHDIAPAKALGIATCWVDRRAGRPGGATKALTGDAQPDITVRTVKELADLIA